MKVSEDGDTALTFPNVVKQAFIPDIGAGVF